MSHHFDSPTAIADGRVNLCDVYAYPGPGSMTNLVLTVNPDAGRSSATTFRPDAVYELAIALDGRAIPDRALRMIFSEPDPDGHQRMTVCSAEGRRQVDESDGSALGSGPTEEVFPLDDGSLAWFGVAGDPFWGDGVALAQFMQGLAAGQYRPDAFASAPANIFAGRNVTAIALQVPNRTLGADHVALWARISHRGDTPARQVSRMGNPMVRPLFFPAPGPDSEGINEGSPGEDLRLHAGRLREAAATLAAARGLADPDGHASAVAHAFLPDVLHVRPGQPASYRPGGGNGRGIHDDAFGTALSVFNGSPLGVSSSPHPVVSQFPHLPPVDRSELPALADLFGLRPV